MSEENYGNDSQFAEIVKYISDNMKIPVLGAGGGFAPIGSVIMRLSSTTPQGFLLCDGSVYNIADYPDLATHFASDPEIGSVNAYGGDGITTFAVPDYRGEFIRMCGTNSHTNQGSGANLGVHQDGTAVLDVFTDAANGNIAIIGRKSSGESHIKNSDSSYGGGASGVYSSRAGTFTGGDAYYTTRPTNTSLNFYIKATVSDAEINAFNVYTPREHQVGWWEEKIDGVWKRKPVYERTIKAKLPGTKDQYKTIATLTDVDNVIDCITGALSYTSNIQLIPIPFIYYKFEVSSQAFSIATATSEFINMSIKVTFRYTKSTDDWQTS